MRKTLLLVAALLLLPVLAIAQSAPSATESLSISVSPKLPAPYSQATLSFSSGGLNLTSAILTVAVGGKEIYRGTVQPVQVTLGRAGSVATITATVTINGISYRQSAVIQPEDVLLVAEPAASVPPLYPGKSSVPLDGSVRVVAVAHLSDAGGKTLDPAALSYVWTVDGARVANASGIGKSSVLVAAPLQYRSRTVSVLVSSQDGSLVGGDSLSFSPSEPSVRIYENDPLLGVRFDRALAGAYAIAGSESSLYATVFSLPTSASPLLEWFLNGTQVQTGSMITLRPTGSGQGTASLSFSASSGQHVANQNLSLSFGAKSSSFFFGL